MDIRDKLRESEAAGGAAIEFSYTEQGDGVSGGGQVGIRYVKGAGGYFAAVSTRYTQSEQPYVKVAGDEMTGPLVNTAHLGFDGEYAIENRPLIEDPSSNP